MYHVFFIHSSVNGHLDYFHVMAARLLCPWDFPGKNTGMGCHFLLHNECLLCAGYCSKSYIAHLIEFSQDLTNVSQMRNLRQER